MIAKPGVILVVDDDQDVRALVRNEFEGIEFTSHVCASAADGERILDHHRVDVALVDQDLGAGVEPGLNFLKRLREFDPDCFRVLFTATADLAFTVNTINRGLVDAFLLKPWTHEQMVSLLQQGFETARLRRQNRALMQELIERNRELERFNHQLEHSVAERTRHLQSAQERIQEKQQELVRSETQGAVSQLARGLAHELNNPLAAILGYAQRLQRRLSTDEDTVSRLNVIVSEVGRCRALVDQLRNLAQPLDEALLAFHPEKSLMQAIERIQDAGQSPPACSVVGNIPPVLCGRSSLVRIFEQLIDNAMAAGARNCWFRGEISGDRVQLRLDNDGDTPSDEVIVNAVKPFFTTHSSLGKRGLGLTIAAALLREQGGTIALDKRPDGPGASCTIWLPSAPGFGSRVTSLVPAVKGKRIVLIVDDEPLIAELLHDCMTDVGCQTMSVGSVADALEQIENDSVLAVLADMHLPDGTGLDLLARATAIRPELQGRVAIVTGDDQSSAAKRLVDQAGYPVLIKPFRLEQVSALMRKLLT